jgi:signal transduction histidine kinase/CheY-like chemotaxis protein
LFAKYAKDGALYLRRYLEDGKEQNFEKYSADAKLALRYATDLQALDAALYGGSRSGSVAANGTNRIHRFHGFLFVDRGLRLSNTAIEFDQQLAELGARARGLAAEGRVSPRARSDLLTRVDDLTDRWIAFEERYLRSFVNGSLLVSGTTIYTLLVCDLILLLLGFLFFSYFGRTVVKQIDRVSVAVNRIAQGDLSARCTVGFGPEFSQLAEGINQMATNIGHNQTELKFARDKALQASRVKSEFLANMSHEIRTPLNVVIGYTDLLSAQIPAEGNGEVQENLDAIRRAGRRLIRTIQGILDFSKIEAHSFDLRPETLQLGKTLERHVQDMRVLAERKSLELICSVEEPRATVLFDEYCLSGALTNLLQNAIKFTKEGSIKASLYRGPDRRLRVTVKDTGIGIDIGYLSRIFEPFSQEESGYSRAFEGNGLGLALTKRYLELNGATVEVQSRKGHGSTFTIAFSTESEIKSAITQLPSNVPIIDTPPEKNGVRATILLVEDDEDNQSLTRKLLEARFDVRVASSAEDARRELAANSINLILMDWSLRGAEDGVSLTRSLRQDERFKGIPVVALTAHALPEDRKLATATGFDGFLGKPINRGELFRTLDLLIHQ